MFYMWTIGGAVVYLVVAGIVAAEIENEVNAFYSGAFWPLVLPVAAGKYIGSALGEWRRVRAFHADMRQRQLATEVQLREAEVRKSIAEIDQELKETP